MKKRICFILCICFLCMGLNVYAASPITVMLDCAEIEFPQDPVMQDDRTLVPVRAIFEAMGATVNWNEETKTITSVLDDTTVVMTLNSQEMSVNGVSVTLDIPPQLIEGSTMVPARAVAESFDCKVEWDGALRRVMIFTKSFSEKIAATKIFCSVEKLTHDDRSAVAAFSIPYFDEYEVTTKLPDGTIFEADHSTDTEFASFSVRTDLYVGEEQPLNDDYAKRVADDVVSVASGTLVSYDIVTICGIEFIKIAYTAPRALSDSADETVEQTVYIGRKNGVVYTISHAVYGEINPEITKEINYMINALIIA